IIYLGDGRSVAGPLDVDDRAHLVSKLVGQQTALFPVPLGDRLDPHNLHGLATGTGGKCVRLDGGLDGGLDERNVGALAKGLLKALAEPILYAPDLRLPAAVTDVLPTKLPPLRRDAPTLVV